MTTNTAYRTSVATPTDSESIWANMGAKAVWTAEDCNAAVARGAAFVRAHAPGALRSIDLSLLDMRDANRCVIGQSCERLLANEDHFGSLPDYSSAVMYFANKGSDDWEDGTLWAVEHGFEAPFIVRQPGDDLDVVLRERAERWAMLQCAWESVIVEEQIVQEKIELGDLAKVELRELVAV